MIAQVRYAARIISLILLCLGLAVGYIFMSLGFAAIDRHRTAGLTLLMTTLLLPLFMMLVMKFTSGRKAFWVGAALGSWVPILIGFTSWHHTWLPFGG